MYGCCLYFLYAQSPLEVLKQRSENKMPGLPAIDLPSPAVLPPGIPPPIPGVIPKVPIPPNIKLPPGVPFPPLPPPILASSVSDAAPTSTWDVPPRSSFDNYSSNKDDYSNNAGHNPPFHGRQTPGDQRFNEANRNPNVNDPRSSSITDPRSGSMTDLRNVDPHTRNSDSHHFNPREEYNSRPPMNSRPDHKGFVPEHRNYQEPGNFDYQNRDERTENYRPVNPEHNRGNLDLRSPDHNSRHFVPPMEARVEEEDRSLSWREYEKRRQNSQHEEHPTNPPHDYNEQRNDRGQYPDHHGHHQMHNGNMDYNQQQHRGGHPNNFNEPPFQNLQQPGQPPPQGNYNNFNPHPSNINVRPPLDARHPPQRPRFDGPNNNRSMHHNFQPREEIGPRPPRPPFGDQDNRMPPVPFQNFDHGFRPEFPLPPHQQNVDSQFPNPPPPNGGFGPRGPPDSFPPGPGRDFPQQQQLRMQSNIHHPHGQFPDAPPDHQGQPNDPRFTNPSFPTDPSQNMNAPRPPFQPPMSHGQRFPPPHGFRPNNPGHIDQTAQGGFRPGFHAQQPNQPRTETSEQLIGKPNPPMGIQPLMPQDESRQLGRKPWEKSSNRDRSHRSRDSNRDRSDNKSNRDYERERYNDNRRRSQDYNRHRDDRRERKRRYSDAEDGGSKDWRGNESNRSGDEKHIPEDDRKSQDSSNTGKPQPLLQQQKSREELEEGELIEHDGEKHRKGAKNQTQEGDSSSSYSSSKEKWRTNESGYKPWKK